MEKTVKERKVGEDKMHGLEVSKDGRCWELDFVVSVRSLISSSANHPNPATTPCVH